MPMLMNHGIKRKLCINSMIPWIDPIQESNLCGSAWAIEEIALPCPTCVFFVLCWWGSFVLLQHSPSFMLDRGQGKTRTKNLHPADKCEFQLVCKEFGVILQGLQSFLQVPRWTLVMLSLPRRENRAAILCASWGQRYFWNASSLSRMLRPFPIPFPCLWLPHKTTAPFS